MNIKHLLLSFFLLITCSVNAQVVKVQFINNCADVSLHGFDIYLDGNQIFNDLHFREATPFMDINVGPNVEIGFSELTSLNITDTLFRIFTPLIATQTYVIVINGIESTSGYSPLRKLSADVYDMGKPGTINGQTAVLFANGSTDAPTMDIRTGMSTLGNNLQYRQFSATYAELNSSLAYTFRLTNTTGSKTTHSYSLDIPAINLDAKSITIVTSGFINRAANSNGEKFGLWYADENGGPLIELDTMATPEALARIQLIHNSADTAVSAVDVYINNEKVADTLQFRHATEYLDAFGNLPLNVTLTKPGLTIPFYNTSITLDSAGTYIAMLSGISDSSKNYSPRPPMGFRIKQQAKEEPISPGSADLLFMHGATDEPAVDITFNNDPVFINNLAYGQFTNYLTGVTTHGGSGDHIITLDSGSTSTLHDKYILPYNAWGLSGKTVTIVLSGFVKTANNSNGEKFGLWAAIPEGGAMRELPVYVSVKDVINETKEIAVWPNPASHTISFDKSMKIQTLLVTDITGRIVIKEEGLISNAINIHNLSTGNYIMMLVDTDGRIMHAKFTKE